MCGLRGVSCNIHSFAVIYGFLLWLSGIWGNLYVYLWLYDPFTLEKMIKHFFCLISWLLKTQNTDDSVHSWWGCEVRQSLAVSEGVSWCLSWCHNQGTKDSLFCDSSTRSQSITDLPLALLPQSVGGGPKWARRETQSPNEENKEAEIKTGSPRSEELKANVGIVSVWTHARRNDSYILSQHQKLWMRASGGSTRSRARGV